MTDKVDPRIAASFKRMLQEQNVEVVIISGSPAVNDQTVDEWRRANTPLRDAFGDLFTEEIRAKKMRIFGCLGGQELTAEGGAQGDYPLKTSFGLSHLLLEAFLRELSQHGSAEQKTLADRLQVKLSKVELEDENQPTNLTAREYKEIAETVCGLDNLFHLVNNGPSLACKTTFPWVTESTAAWVRQELEKRAEQLGLDPAKLPTVSTGGEKRGDIGMRYLLISQTNKGPVTEKLLAGRDLSTTLVLTVGDGEVDYAMHEKAAAMKLGMGVAFHVGPKDIWDKKPLHQCVMVVDKNGQDKQHLEGTLHVLNLVQEAVGKTFAEFRFIPQRGSDGHVEYRSLNEALST